MQPFSPTLALLPPGLLFGAIGAVATAVVSFLIITLIASYYRFQHIVEQAENTQPEEMGATAVDILRVQLARYLARCARSGASFSVSLLRINDAVQEIRMDSLLITALKKAARCNDVTCIYDSHTIVLLLEAEPEDSEKILKRIVDSVSADLPNISADLFRVGIASYPGHGLSGKHLLDMANEGLAASNADRPIVLPEIEDVDAEEADDDADATLDGEDSAVEEAAPKSRRRRKRSMLDELTGVLKPSAVSAYMQRLMSDLRHKKKKACLFCIGVNNMEHIARFHGQDAANDVLAGVSHLLQENLRADDLIGRHEKYAFLALVQASLEEAEIIGKRISTLIQKTQIASGNKKIKVTITLGVAAFPEHGRNLHTLYKAGQKVLDYSRTNDIRAYAVYDPEIHARVSVTPIKSIKSIQA